MAEKAVGGRRLVNIRNDIITTLLTLSQIEIDTCLAVVALSSSGVDVGGEGGGYRLLLLEVIITNLLLQIVFSFNKAVLDAASLEDLVVGASSSWARIISGGAACLPDFGDCGALAGGDSSTGRGGAGADGAVGSWISVCPFWSVRAHQQVSTRPIIASTKFPCKRLLLNTAIHLCLTTAGFSYLIFLSTGQRLMVEDA